MLDQSIPYKDIVMLRPAGPAQAAALPAGYSLRMYQPGDAQHWARIETSVNEFENQAQALAYFERTFLRQEALLPSRLVFAVDPSGVPVANSSIWFEEIGGRTVPLVHWVAAHPDSQGLGLGRAVVLGTLELSHALHPGEPIFLHTQTWSHVAVRLYLRVGFRPVRDGHVGKKRSSFPEACAVLRGVFEPKTFRMFSEEAVFLPNCYKCAKAGM